MSRRRPGAWGATEIAGHEVPPGTRRNVEIPVARLPTQTMLTLPVAVLRGARPGASAWISAAVHGDELNGVEIVRRVLARTAPEQLAGTLYAVPLVNVFGFVAESRTLPDRRDLNRAFPGSARGSLASRVAHLFFREIVLRCSHGIDLHTGSDHRTNLPQVRCDLDVAATASAARAFGAPVTLHAAQRDGSLRQAAAARGIHVLAYEGGEALRFDEEAIATGTDGVLRVLAALRMLPREAAPARARTRFARRSTWLRAPRSGLLRLHAAPGERVRAGRVVGEISDLFDDERVPLRAPATGIVLGRTLSPAINQGEAILHVTRG